VPRFTASYEDAAVNFDLEKHEVSGDESAADTGANNFRENPNIIMQSEGTLKAYGSPVWPQH
jgi:hypothetical protein